MKEKLERCDRCHQNKKIVSTVEVDGLFRMKYCAECSDHLERLVEAQPEWEIKTS